MARVEEVKPEVKPLDRSGAIAAIERDELWDVVVVGGGATGAGVALDAASRGLRTLLLEAQDFSAGTSSRSTKLIHGGVRYMKNVRDWGLVHDALQERKRLIENCPKLVHAEPFVLPCFKKYEREIYTLGLGLYGAMAGAAKIGRTRTLSAEETAARLPGVKTEGLLGGVEFFDAQFDDARLNIALLRTAATSGAVCVNYMPVTAVERTGGLIQSVTAEDAETGVSRRIRTKMVFNCAGVWADRVRKLVDPDAPQLIRFSRGTHVVVDRSHLSGEAGMFIPKTPDGRVLFAIPWHDAVLLGTTDVEVREADMKPQPSEDEISFILETASQYLAKPVMRSDVMAAFCGLRPLVKAPAGHESTAKASREHSIIAEFGNMITIAGGKWTSYRKMAEDAMLEATLRHLVAARLCVTKTLPILVDDTFDPRAVETALMTDSPEAEKILFAYARYARDFEGARTAEDVLWRRLRIGILSEERAARLLPKVALVLEGREPQPDPEPEDILQDAKTEEDLSQAAALPDAVSGAAPVAAKNGCGSCAAHSEPNREEASASPEKAASEPEAACSEELKDAENPQACRVEAPSSEAGEVPAGECALPESQAGAEAKAEAAESVTEKAPEEAQTREPAPEESGRAETARRPRRSKAEKNEMPHEAEGSQER